MMVITEAAPGGTRQQAQARHQPAEQAAGDDDRQHAGGEKQPVAQDVAHDRQRHHAGDHAADDPLGHDEGGQGKAHLAAA
jgi:hypothetical protein